MIKSVKQALGNGEGCRVCYSSTGSYLIYRMVLQALLIKLCPQFSQVYGMLDVQRVAGNFHISVHGLNIFVAEKVSNPKFQIQLFYPLYILIMKYVYFLYIRLMSKLLKKLNYNASDFVL